MRGAKRAVQLCCTSDLQRRSAPKVGESNVHVICEQALSHPRLLVVCDRLTIRIHTQFNGHPSEVHNVLLQELDQPENLPCCPCACLKAW